MTLEPDFTWFASVDYTQLCELADYLSDRGDASEPLRAVLAEIDARDRRRTAHVPVGFTNASFDIEVCADSWTIVSLADSHRDGRVAGDRAVLIPELPETRMPHLRQ